MTHRLLLAPVDFCPNSIIPITWNPECPPPHLFYLKQLAKGARADVYYNFRENTKALVISKRLNSPSRITEQIQILKHHLECISRDLQVLWITQKVFSMFL